MESIINIQIPESTINKPIRFFDGFFNCDSIKLAKQSFNPDLNDEHSYWNRFPISNLVPNESFEIEYEVEIGYDADTGESINESKSREYIFKKELTKLLRQEHDKSVYFLSENLDQKLNKYKADYFLERIVHKLLQQIKLANKIDVFAQYKNECKRPLLALIRDIYEKFPSSVLKKANKKVQNILKSTAKSKILYAPQELKIGIARAITEIKNKYDDLIFPFDDENEAIDMLRYFIRGEFDKITTPIIFKINIQAAYYLIYQIAKLQRFKGSYIEAAKIFCFNNKEFNVSSYYKAISLFSQKNSDLKSCIDKMISANLR